MKQVILRLVLKSGTDVRSVMSELEARKWVDDFRRGKLSGRLSDSTGWWSVDAAELVAAQYIEIQQQAPPIPPIPYQSGGRN